MKRRGLRITSRYSGRGRRLTMRHPPKDVTYMGAPKRFLSKKSRETNAARLDIFWTGEPPRPRWPEDYFLQRSDAVCSISVSRDASGGDFASAQSSFGALTASATGELIGATTAAGGLAVGTSSMAERLSNAASRKLPQIISPPMTTPRSTMLPLGYGRGDDPMASHSPVRRVLAGHPAVMCPLGQRPAD